MSVYGTMRDYLVTVIDAVPNTGVVHNRERYIVDKAKFLEAFALDVAVGDREIRGWVVTLDGGIESDDATMDDTQQRSWNWVVYGIQGIRDGESTEHTFYDLVLDVMNAIDDAHPTWGGVPGMVVSSATAAAARNLGPRQFGSVLCHYAEVHVSVWVDR